MIIGESTMFFIAVTWWWWAMYVLRNLVNHWDETRLNVKDVLTDVQSIRTIVVDLLREDK